MSMGVLYVSSPTCVLTTPLLTKFCVSVLASCRSSKSRPSVTSRTVVVSQFRYLIPTGNFNPRLGWADNPAP
jgi:hypothetical protein